MTGVIGNIIGCVLLLVGLGVSALAIPALIKPSWLGLNSRLYAFPMGLTWLAAFCLIFAFIPDFADGQPLPTDVRIAAGVIVALWFGMTGACWVVARKSGYIPTSSSLMGKFKADWSKFKSEWATLKADSALDWANLKAEYHQHAKRDELKREQRQQAKADRRADAARKADEAKRATAAKIAELQMKADEEEGRRNWLAAQERKGADGRLDDVFEKLRQGEIELEAYRDAVASEEGRLREKQADLEDKSEWAPELYEYDRECLEEDREAIRWRKQWLDDQSYREKISRPGFASNGKWARFEYVDNDGVITAREIVRWEKRGGYIVGYDKTRQAERTFRQDRISDWKAG